MSQTRSGPARAFSAAVLLCASVLASLTGGCGWSSCDIVRFSPDGRTIAFTRQRGTFAGFTVGLTPVGFGTEAVEVYWCPVERTDQLRSANVHRRGPIFPAPSAQEHVKQIAFSPDSTHLAVRTERRLIVADLVTGEGRQIDIGRRVPHSITWLTSDQVAYATTSPAKQTRPDIHLARWTITAREDGPEKPAYQVETDPSRAKLFWSPRGRYALLQPSWQDKTRLVDLTTGTSSPVGPGSMQLQACAWKPDASALFCAMAYTQKEAEQTNHPVTEMLLLVDPRDGSVRRLPHDDLNLLATVRSAEWTPDGKYVLIDDGWTNCALIQVEPWHVISLKKRVTNTLQAHGRTVTSWKELHPLPAPGWLWLRDHNGTCLALDYRWETLVELATGSHWAHSPDGTRLAEVDQDGHVTLRRLNLPAGPPDPPPGRPKPKPAPLPATPKASP